MGGAFMSKARRSAAHLSSWPSLFAAKGDDGDIGMMKKTEAIIK